MAGDPIHVSVMRAELSGGEAHLVTAGSGRPVLAFGKGFEASPGFHALAHRFRVVSFEADVRDPRRTGEAAAAWVREQGLEAIGLIGLKEAAACALWCASILARDEPPPTALVLVSPRGLPLLGAASGDDPLQPWMKDLPTPKALLLGTEDPDLPPRATEIKRSFSKAHVVLVAGAGCDLDTERPEAFSNSTGDFLDRQADFRLATETVAIQP